MMLDDYSKFCWVVVLRAKSDTADQLPHLIALCETQMTPRLVQRVRSDRGGEFEGRLLLAFYRSKGIVPETTVGYAPQQNCAAKALLKSTNDMGRTMHRGAALPPEEWGMSLKHAAWVRNRLPAAGTGKNTPHELLLGTKPDMHGLPVYGFPAYAMLPGPHVRKMAMRSEAGRYMGVGAAGSLFLPRGAHKCVKRRDISVPYLIHRLGTLTPNEAERAGCPDA